MNENKVCGHCRHYRPHQSGGPSGHCWFNPPTPLLIGMKDGNPIITAARTPVAGNTGACGQFDQKIILEAVQMPSSGG